MQLTIASFFSVPDTDFPFDVILLSIDASSISETDAEAGGFCGDLFTILFSKWLRVRGSYSHKKASEDSPKIAAEKELRSKHIKFSF